MKQMFNINMIYFTLFVVFSIFIFKPLTIFNEEGVIRKNGINNLLYVVILLSLIVDVYIYSNNIDISDIT